MPEYLVVAPEGVIGGFRAVDAAEAYRTLGDADPEADLYVKVGVDDAVTEEDAVSAGMPVAVQLVVHPLTDGYRVEINGYAETCAERLAVALAMALPYVESVVVPDPLEQLWRGLSAPDGPPDGGGGGV